MQARPLPFLRPLVIAALCVGWAGPADALDRVLLRRDGQEIRIEGRRLVTAQDGGIVLLARDGVLWAVPPRQQVKVDADDAPFVSLSREELSERLLAELPPGFDVHHTAHYMICYATSRAYAQWCGALFERLYMAFTNYWRRKGFELVEPEFPLVAVVFADKRAFVKHSAGVLGNMKEKVVGYYSLRTNRMTMYDLTGTEKFRRFVRDRSTASGISRMLSRPEALQTVSTIIHEATHQIAYNCGLHVRYSDCPLWFSEGIAVYFETPDLRSAKGWRGIGNVNRPRLVRFRQYLAARPADSLKTLIRDDERFRNPQQSLDAYAEAWALTYFLIRRHPKQYVAYLAMLSKKKPLLDDEPQERIEQFEAVFGKLDALNVEFVRYLLKVR